MKKNMHSIFNLPKSFLDLQNKKMSDDEFYINAERVYKTGIISTIILFLLGISMVIDLFPPKTLSLWLLIIMSPLLLASMGVVTSVIGWFMIKRGPHPNDLDAIPTSLKSASSSYDLSITWKAVTKLNIHKPKLLLLLPGLYDFDFWIEDDEGSQILNRVHTYYNQTAIVALANAIKINIATSKMTSKAMAIVEAISAAYNYVKDDKSSDIIEAVKLILKNNIRESLKNLNDLYKRNILDDEATFILARLSYFTGDYITANNILADLRRRSIFLKDVNKYLGFIAAENK